MNRKPITLITFLSMGLLLAEDPAASTEETNDVFGKAEPALENPTIWQVAYGRKGNEIRDHLLENDGKVTAEELLDLSYTLGSIHDGDQQLATATVLLQLDDDPIPHLKKMMGETEPERRAFAVLISGMIEDRRLKLDIERLLKDDAKLGDFPGDWHWNTVADIAKEAMSSHTKGALVSHWLNCDEFEFADWLKLVEVKEAQPNSTE